MEEEEEEEEEEVVVVVVVVEEEAGEGEARLHWHGGRASPRVRGARRTRARSGAGTVASNIGRPARPRYFFNE